MVCTREQLLEMKRKALELEQEFNACFFSCTPARSEISSRNARVRELQKLWKALVLELELRLERKTSARTWSSLGGLRIEARRFVWPHPVRSAAIAAGAQASCWGGSEPRGLPSIEPLVVDRSAVLQGRAQVRVLRPIPGGRAVSGCWSPD
jgi:hypothetical protein